MGGKKRPTLSQLAKKAEKAQQQQQQAQAKAKKKEEAGPKRPAQSAFDKLLEALSKDIQSMPIVTVYEVASKYGVKMTVARKALRALRDKGDLVLVVKGHRTEAYIPARRAAS
ncbi:30S ribosomal protein S25e [Thermoproteus uzoniensis 768-20]|uniref:30S ribosomal protein S25e n=1 Tax=Thermoproteus uzoniensis (strain 768-20) TaxID=999630 RepID=F2L0G7_THEU7|nr:30S ribosomal protein S25e [Thermoproteus uzoniensis]AEA12649.1 30S ribosomal protein S25e [Thermoproteus uzoniensis 768-20]